MSHIARRTCLIRVLALAAPKGAKAAIHRLGIFPSMAPRQTVEFFGPVAASMEHALKHPVRLESTPSFPEFTRAVAMGHYDIALIQPFDYPLAAEKMATSPLHGSQCR